MNHSIDWLEIKNLKIKTKIGIHAWEQQIEQTILLSLKLPLPIAAYPVTLDQTVDYAALCESMMAFVTGHSFDLIENLAEQVAQMILSRYPISHLTLSVSKPLAISQANAITVTIERQQSSG